MPTMTGAQSDAATLESLARMFADYRLKGCPTGGAASLQLAVKKAAKRRGENFSVLWAEVHRLGYRLIDAES